MAIESSNSLNIEEPGADRRQATSDAMREIEAERTEKRANG